MCHPPLTPRRLLDLAEAAKRLTINLYTASHTMPGQANARSGISASIGAETALGTCALFQVCRPPMTSQTPPAKAPPLPANTNTAAPPTPAPPAAAPLPPGAETAEQALNRALAAAKLRRINEAMGICRDVLVASPELPGALGLLGGILGQEGRPDEAIALLEGAIARQPAVANWHLNLCALYRGRNRLDDALRAGQAAVQYSPDTANHRVELALTHLTRGELDEASRYFREAIGREPENAAAHMGMGELLLAQG